MTESKTLSLTDELGFSTDPGPEDVRRNRLGGFLTAIRSWFRAWRRTRPFWGALWLIVAGAWIIYWMSFDIGIALTGGWSYSAGYVMGGALIMFGLVTWLAPHYKSLSGIVAFLIALGAFPTANLGGFVLGSVLGIIGGAMVWSWGEKKPRPSKRVTSGG